jgi:hypothetical protein
LQLSLLSYFTRSAYYAPKENEVMKTTNFDRYLEEQMRDPGFATDTQEFARGFNEEEAIWQRFQEIRLRRRSRETGSALPDSILDHLDWAAAEREIRTIRAVAQTRVEAVSSGSRHLTPDTHSSGLPWSHRSKLEWWPQRVSDTELLKDVHR